MWFASMLARSPPAPGADAPNVVASPHVCCLSPLAHSGLRQPRAQPRDGRGPPPDTGVNIKSD